MQQQQSFEVLVDSVPYFIKATSYSFNGETRYSVNFNGSPDYVFVWDSSVKRMIAVGDDTATLPDNLEVAIAERLLAKRA